MPYLIIGSFEDKGHIVEAGIVDKAYEKVFAKRSFAYFLMPVNT